MDNIHNSALIVNLQTLRNNITSISNTLSGNCSIISVLKGDAYGLGLIECAKAIEDMPEISMFAVAHLSEGLALRKSGIKKNILIIGPCLPDQYIAAADANLTISINRLGIIPELSSLNKEIKVHLKLETGLHRTGLLESELQDVAFEIFNSRSTVSVTGVYSHFLDSSNYDICSKQYTLFNQMIDSLIQFGVTVPFKHISSSESSELFPEYNMDAIRLGRRLFMDNPHPNGSVSEVMQWKTRIHDIRSRKEGDTVGYGGSIVLNSEKTIADIGVGYADGMPVELASQGGTVLINGHYCSILSVCMDQTLVDVSNVKCSIGDIVTIFGKDSNGNELTSQHQALVYGGNEGCSITSALTTRVKREYIYN